MGEDGRCFPKKDTQAYRLLELVAVCGEFPAELIYRLTGSTSYKETVTWLLKKEKLLRVYYRDKMRGYRLGRRAKEILLSDNPERFSFYLTGNVDTNLLKSEVTRRIRLHRIAEVYVAMQNAGVAVFRDEKPKVFAPEMPYCGKLEGTAFFSSREVKELGIEAVKIKGSRMAGVLLAPGNAFLTYNSGPYMAKWDYRAEQRTKALMQIVLCGGSAGIGFAPDRICGLLFGNGMEPFYQILSSADSSARCFFLLDGNYEHTPEYRETSGVGKRPVLTPDEVLRLPIDEALIIIRGKKILKVDKLDYSKHPDYPLLHSCKASAYIPEWRRLEMEAAAGSKNADKRRSSAEEPKTEGTKAKETKAGGSKAKEPKAKAAKAEASKAGTPKEADSREKKSESGQKKGEKKSPPPKAGGQAGIVVTDKESIMS